MKNIFTTLFVIIILFSGLILPQNRNTIFNKPHDVSPSPLSKEFDSGIQSILFNTEPQNIFTDYLNINISGDPFPQNEPSVMISRKNPNRVVAAWRDFRTGVSPAIRRIGSSFSTDGGQTWSVSQLLPKVSEQIPKSSDPVVAIDTSGNFYVVTISLVENTGNGEVWIFKSTDGGVTFDQNFLVANSSGFEDKEWAVTDMNPLSPYSNTMYVSWTRFDSNGGIMLTKSTNEGVTWSSPVHVSDDQNVQGSIPVVGTNGELYVAWLNGSGIVFDKSTDGGVTFGTDKIISNFSNAYFPSMDVDLSNGPRRGYIYVTWHDSRNGDNDVFFSFSSDQGSNWSSPKRVNDDALGNGKTQYWSSIAVNELGEIAILFYDTRNTPSNSIIEAYLARSIDGGSTFTNELLSSEQSPTSTPNGDVRFGDYIDIDFYNNHLVTVWTDERAGGVDMEIYTAFIPITVPVELISFTVNLLDDKTILNWATATELNNLGFEVEKSFDGINFFQIGFIKGNGTTSDKHEYSFSDRTIEGRIYYRLKQVDFDGSYDFSNIVEVSFTNPDAFTLEQNYPNPFNPSTSIKYTIPSNGASKMEFVQLKVFDILGNEVATLVNELKAPGSFEIQFDVGQYKNVSSGIYFYTLTAGNYSQTKKMIFLR